VLRCPEPVSPLFRPFQLFRTSTVLPGNHGDDEQGWKELKKTWRLGTLVSPLVYAAGDSGSSVLFTPLSAETFVPLSELFPAINRNRFAWALLLLASFLVPTGAH
jgi:hypothetical protein